MLNLYSFLIKALDLIHPRLAAKLAYQLLSNPQIKKERQRETELLDTAERLEFDFEGARVHGYSWGPEQGKPLLLIHGWEGHTGNFGALIEPLIQKGYRIYGFDAPSHGRSPSVKTNMFQYAQFLNEMLVRFTPEVIISHSFGTTSTALALRALEKFALDQWIMIASPYTFNSRIEMVRNQYNIPQRTMTALRPLIEHRSGERIDALNFNHYRQYLDGVRQISIIHSRADTVVLYHYAEEIQKALPKANLLTLDKVGHYGILWSQEMLKPVEELIPDLHNRS